MNDIIKDFPILNIKEMGQRLVYLDNGATTQKPQCVIEAVAKYYKDTNANPHRGVYDLAVRATVSYEAARNSVAKFINAPKTESIVFTKNATEGFNLIAYSYALHNLKAGDEILISISEHHANLIPWQQVAKATGAKLKYIYFNENGIYTEEEISSKINDRTKIVSMASISNVLGTKNPIDLLIKKAHEVGAVAIVDAAQSVAHDRTDVQALDCDFLIFSGHKMYAPMGIGVLYGKLELLDKLEPFMTGGDMILSVHEQNASFAKSPNRFEAGTQNVEAAVGLKTAIDYIDKIGISNIIKHEHELTEYAMSRLKELPYVTVYGNTTDLSIKTGLFSFNIDEVHPHDVATIMDSDGVTVRAGHHCAQPLMEYLGIHSCSRASLAVYNTREDIDALIGAISSVRRSLGFES